MAVVRVNYIRTGQKGENVREKAQGTLDYIGHRVGPNKEKMARQLFGPGGPLTEEQAVRRIEGAPKGTRFWRMMISPDPQTEDPQKDLDLWAIAKRTCAELEKRFQRPIDFIAAEHEHTDKKHIHSIVLLQWKERLYVPELMALIERASEASLSQRRDRELLKQHHLEQQYPQRSVDGLTDSHRPAVGMAGGRAKHMRHSRGHGRWTPPRRDCPACEVRGAMVRLNNGQYWCTHCKQVEKQQRLELQQREELSL
jgi:hypothetical protein